jgi:hypothetical protein
LQRPQFAASYKNALVLTHRPPHQSSPGPQFKDGALPAAGGFPVTFPQEGDSNIEEKSSNRATIKRSPVAGSFNDRSKGISVSIRFGNMRGEPTSANSGQMWGTV